MFPEVGQKRVLRHTKLDTHVGVGGNGAPAVVEKIPIEIAEVHFSPQLSVNGKAYVVVDTQGRSWIFAIPTRLPERA